jgi:vitamin B12 transporter
VHESGRLQFNYRFQVDRKELAVDLLSVSPTAVQVIFDKNSELERKFLFNSMEYQDRIIPWLGLSWKAALVDTDFDWSNPEDPGSTMPSSYFEETDTRTLVLDLQQNLYIADSDTLSFGIEWKNDTVRSNIEAFGSSYPVDQSRRNMAYYLQNLYKGREKWIFQTGVRIDENSSFETVVNPKVSTAYVFESTKTRLRGSWGMGYRAPTIQDQFFPAFGNPGLEPEKSRSWEVGLQQRVLRETIILDAVYFWIDYDDLIQRSPMGVDNIGKARSRGVESSLEMRSFTTLTVKANYTYLDVKDRITGQELPFRARHRGNINLLYAPMLNLTINMDVNLVSSQALPFVNSSPVIFNLLDGTTVSGQGSGFSRVDLSGTYYLFGNLVGLRETRFFIKIRNLFDRDYQDLPGFPAPGRGILGGVTVVL